VQKLSPPNCAHDSPLEQPVDPAHDRQIDGAASWPGDGVSPASTLAGVPES
jgi:hypothetical protein